MIRSVAGHNCLCKLNLEGDRSAIGLVEEGVICDWREPDILRVAPVPLYNSYQDVYRFVEHLSKIIS